MIGTTSAEFLLIRGTIYVFHYIAPICILYTTLAIFRYGTKAAFFRVPLILECIALAETLFYFFVHIPYSYYLQREAVHPPAPSRAERAELFKLCMRNVENTENYLQRWFLGAPLEDIKRENVKDFLLWAFFNRGGPPGDDEEELEEYLGIAERSLGQEIEPGRGKAVCLRLTLDKVDMMHRSLAWYTVIGLVDTITHLNLLYQGFKFHRTSLSSLRTTFPFRPLALTTSHISPAKHTSYFIRPHTSKTRLPILFIHGIGIGLFPYTDFFSELNSHINPEGSNPEDQVGILAIEILPVSFRICHAPLSKPALCFEINQILAHHNWSKFVLVSHSYGTVVSTYLLKDPEIAPKISATFLVDPVSILLHLPDVAYNFTRRKPTKANEWQLYYFASMDMGVSHTLGRHFFWSECVLWKKDIKGRNITAGLASDDLIVDTLQCGRYLTTECTKSNPEGNLLEVDERGAIVRSNLEGRTDEWKEREWKGEGTEVLWFEGMDHAQVFDVKEERERMIGVIEGYCRNGEGL